jgi:HEAT repeats
MAGSGSIDEQMTKDKDFLAPERRLPERPSQLVERKAFPRVVAREDLERRLRVHDTYGEGEASFRSNEFDLLRQIALASNASEPDLWVRRNAISVLATQPTPENLEVLTLLARANPDVNVRAEAVLALGRTGVVAVAAVLADALGARDSLEGAAARRALQHLAAAAGAPAVVAALPAGRRLARRVSEAIEERPKPKDRGPQNTGADMDWKQAVGGETPLNEGLSPRETR